jgi:membrane fusion protein (multidrug efflux system)
MLVCKRVFFILVLLFIFFLIPSCQKKRPKMPPPLVEATKVTVQDIAITSEWIGTTAGLINVTVRAQVQGYLIQRSYKEGDFVPKGQILFEIDPRPFRAELTQAEAQLKQSHAQLYTAQNDLEMVRPLAAQNALSQHTLDNSIGTARTAEGMVNGGQAAVALAKLNLQFTYITSPIDGIAGLIQSDIGDLVGPSQPAPLTTVTQIDPILFVYSVNEQFYRQHSPYFQNSSDTAPQYRVHHELYLADGTKFAHTGKLYAIDNQVDPRTGTIRIKAVFPNPDNTLRPGQFARVRIWTGITKNAHLIPQRAVTELQGTDMVAVVTPKNYIDLRKVQTGQKIGPMWEILSGVDSGETVVTEGIQKVRPGMEVRPEFPDDTVR